MHEHSVSGLTAVLERYGGKLAISAGERLMGVFGVASVHEDDALRAARASLEARSALATEAGILLRRHGVSLACRFGLATGEALVGGSGPLGFAGDAEDPGGDCSRRPPSLARSSSAGRRKSLPRQPSKRKAPVPIDSSCDPRTQACVRWHCVSMRPWWAGTRRCTSSKPRTLWPLASG